MDMDVIRRNVFGKTIPEQWAPWLVFLLGVVFSFGLQLTIPVEIFFSGDGGIKALLVKQFSGGELRPDLRLEVEAWVHDLWRGGLYPFAPPFVYELAGRQYVQYPLPFLWLSSPFYAALGYRGLYIIPLGSVWLVWLCFLVACRKLGVRGWATSVATAGLIFASHLSLYSAMFWEHTLAVALAFGGVALLLPAKYKMLAIRRGLIGGLLLGMSVCIRSECGGIFVGMALVLLLARTAVATWLSFISAGSVAVLGLLIINKMIYGLFLGVHSLQQVESTEAHVAHQPAMQIASGLFYDLAVYCPMLIWAVAAAMLPCCWRILRPIQTQVYLWFILVIFTVFALLILPNEGGMQIGPRYFLPIVPLISLVVAIQLERLRVHAGPMLRRSSSVLLALILIAGSCTSAIGGSISLFKNYHYRVLPALKEIQSLDTPIIAVSTQWMAQELAAALDDKIFVRVRRGADIQMLAETMLEQNYHRFLWVHWKDSDMREQYVAGLHIRVAPHGQYGQYHLFAVTVTTNDRR